MIHLIRTTAIVTGIVLASALAGCGGNEDIDITALSVEVDPADVLYNQALANIKAGKLREASRKFDAIDKQHPYSEYARKSMVMNSFVNYKMGHYSESINSAISCCIARE